LVAQFAAGAVKAARILVLIKRTHNPDRSHCSHCRNCCNWCNCCNCRRIGS